MINPFINIFVTYILVQRTLLITTAFVMEDFAVKLNLLF